MKKLPWYFKLAYLFCLPAALLSGCAQLAQPVQGVRAFQAIGENEEGVQFFRYHCKPRE